ncbi:hypothetical protein BD408DRAFT_438500 [Parasitella parasitica]|nr:hypothetical protein BD408DRAFT_438500 [Parasitella parasitica]
MNYNSSAPLQRQRNVYVCNICQAELDGYVARNNHSRSHPNVSPVTYTIRNDGDIAQSNGRQTSYALDLDNSSHTDFLDVSNVDYDGDTQMEDVPADADFNDNFTLPAENNVRPNDHVEVDFDRANLDIPYKTSGEFEI